MDEKTMNVIAADEVKGDLDSIKSDVASLREQMENDREATGLKIEERADDLEKAVAAVEDITKRMEAHEKMLGEARFESSFGDSSGELKDALDSFRIGFEEHNSKSDEADPIWHRAGTKPQLKHLVEGVFFKTSDDPDDDMRTFHAPRHHAIRRLQKAADDVYIVDAMMRASMDENEKANYERSGGARTLGVFEKFAHRRDEFVKAAADLIDTGTEVANWLPTQYSANLYEQVKIGLPLLNLFPEVAMSAPTMVLPLDLNDHEALRVTEVTSTTAADPYADGDFNNPSALSSNSITANAEKLRARYWITRDAEEDAIVAMIPFLNRKGRRNMGEAIEDAIVNGQITGNIDTALTHFGKSNPPASSDARDCWDGLRYFFQQYASTPATRVDNSNAAPTVTALRSIRAAMGEYGVDPGMLVHILGPYGYVTLLDDNDVMTVDKFGPSATVRTGTLAMVDGVEVVTSRRIPENASDLGNIDNNGAISNRTLALTVHTEAALLFNRRRITVGTQEHVSSDSRELVWFWRGDFQPVYPAASVPFGGELYNIAAA